MIQGRKKQTFLKAKVKVAQSCPTVCNPTDYTVHRILQARILEWGAVHFSRGSSQPRDQTQVSLIAGRFFTSWATREGKPLDILQFRSVAQSCPTLWSHGLQHASLPCPSPTPGASSNSCPSSRWSCSTISSSFSSHLQSFPASVSFQLSQFFASGGQSIGVSASASVLPMNIQDWFPWGWNDWISLQSKRLSRVFSNTTVQKHKFFWLSFLYSPTLTSIRDYWKNHSFD